MNILITGATGFVGENLTDYLKRKNNYIKTLSARYVSGQFFEIKENVVVHLAGKAHDLKKVSKPSDYYEANFELTKQIFDSFLKSDASVFIFLSSVKAVADQVIGILTEDTVPNPKTHYGISKKQAEDYLLNANLPDTKRLYIIRPCMIHGPGNKGNLNLLYQIVDKKLPWPLGAYNNERSFLSIENLCFVINELIQNEGVSNGIYHLGDDEAISTNELIETIGTSLGKKSKILNVSPWIINKIANLGDYLPLPLNSDRLQKLTESYVISNSKIKEAIQKELPISTKEGLIKTIKSFEQNI